MASKKSNKQEKVLEIEVIDINGYKINILGTEYTIWFKDYKDVPEFKAGRLAGYCNMMAKEIVICDVETSPDYTEQPEDQLTKYYKEVMRHEIIHAFLYESGLDNESHNSNNWAIDEEIIDWLAIQSPKLFSIFSELDLL